MGLLGYMVGVFFFFFNIPNVMGLFYFIPMQDQRFHYCTEANTLQGYKKVVYDM